MLGLEGRVAVVTGAGRGIGRLVARRFAAEGATVALLSRGEEALRAVERELRDSGADVVGIVMDVADRQQVERAFEQIVKELGPPQILVNCAHSWGSAENLRRDMSLVPLESFVDEEWDHALRTGLMGCLYSMVAALPSMRSAGWGRIVNFYSPMAAQALPNLGSYNCTKAAVLALTQTAAREWGKNGITVNCISPSVADDGTRSWFDAIEDETLRAAAEEAYWNRLLVNREANPARDVAATVTFLCSNESSFITGQVLSVDGGLSLTSGGFGLDGN